MNDEETNIIGIFPTPIYITKLNRNLTEEELFFINKNKLNIYKNTGNFTSNNSYILDHEIFKNLKIELNLKIKDYFNKVLSANDKITPYITQSWLNYTEKGQYHHKHNHSNSIVSGVFYIDCNEQFDKIKFFNDNYKTIRPEVKEWNLWNCEAWWCSVKVGNIIMFPSSLNHMVDTKEGDNTRISLAFNTFIYGSIGSKERMTELILNKK